MTHPILAQLPLWPKPDLTCVEPGKQGDFINLHTAWLHPEHLPAYITQSATIMRMLDLLGPLDWDHVPERDLKPTLGHAPVPYAALMAAELIKLNEGLPGLKHLHRFLSEHPGFISLLNFSPRHALHLGFSFNTPLRPPVYRPNAIWLACCARFPIPSSNFCWPTAFV